MSRIVDINGNPIESGTLRETQTSRLAALHREWGLHPSRGLTPQKMARIFDDAEIGNLTRQAELFEDMEEKDAHIHAEMSKRKRALLTLDWSIVPPRNASADEKRQAAEIEEMIREVPNLEDVMLDALNAIGYGYACLEIEWQRLGNLWMPKCIEHRPQSWFVMDRATRTELRLRNAASIEGESLQPFGWIKHIHRAKSGYLARAGLYRVLAWPYLYKNYAARDLAEFLEIYGLPLRLGKYPGGAQEDEKTTLLRALIDIGHNAAGIIPQDMEIEFKEAARGTHDPYEFMVSWCERSASKAILGGTLTSGSDGKSSTNALGKVHNEVRHDLLVSDARQLEGTLARDLIYPIAALNRANVDPRRLPRVQFDTREIEDLTQIADALPKLTAIGMRIPTSYAHNKLRIPVAKEGEEVLTAPKTKIETPPQPDAGKSAATRAVLAALKNETAAGGFPDQAALDAAITTLPAEAIQAAMESIVKPALDTLLAGGSPDDALDKLIDAYPTMNSEALQALLARAMFIADVWGQLNADA